jgi:hypothetical protein
MSLRDQILSAEDRPFEDVPTPEWEKAGVSTVRIITMASNDRDEWEAAALIARAREQGTNRLRGLRAELVVRCAVDPETGERIFKSEDVERLGGKSAKVLDRLFAAATRLNAVTDADMRALEKNSARGRTGDSFSVLRWLQVASMWTGSLRNLLPGKSTSGEHSKESKAIH